MLTCGGPCRGRTYGPLMGRPFGAIVARVYSVNSFLVLPSIQLLHHLPIDSYWLYGFCNFYGVYRKLS